jgi:ribose transport system permease protein
MSVAARPEVAADRSLVARGLTRASSVRFLDESGVLLGVLLVALLFAGLIGPQFLTGDNLELMARQTAIICVAALGMTMVIVSGGIDLSVGSIIALSTVVTALLLRADSGPTIAAAGAVVAGLACGATNGLLITRLKVVPFIVTLGTMLLVRGAAKGLADERRIEAPITWLNALLRTTRDNPALLLPLGIWITILLAIVVSLTLRYTRFGRHLFAIGSNERTARLCGVRVGRTRVAVYTAAGALAGFAGLMQFAKLSVGDPTVAVGLELDVIAAVIIGGGSLSGGKGSVLGTFGGAAIMAIIQIGCSQYGLQNWVQQMVTGAIIVLAVGLDRWRQASAAERKRPA